MITSIYFENFKALGKFSVSLKDFNILTGPNNNGKSTIIDALRLLKGAYGFASRRNPSYYEFPNGHKGYGYQIPQASLPIALENIQNIDSIDFSTIRFRFNEGQSLFLVFSDEHPTYLYYDTPRRVPMNSSAFKKEFSINISVIPTLGPLEINEELLTEDYVKQWSGSRRAPRMFRSYWYYNPENFDLFKGLVEQSWEGISISFPEKKNVFSKELVMFCYENRSAREISWSGFGFQIWLQLLTHIIKSKDADLIVVDEPEIYLHPDLQHKILELLKKTKAVIILATHSVEIINNAEPSEILIVDKTKRSAKRISDLIGLQQASNLLGSSQNLQLTRLARGKKILFVEGQDVKLLSKLAKTAGFKDMFDNNKITTVPIEGFSQNERVLHADWVFNKILGENLRIAAIFDRDYRTDQEIQVVVSKFETKIDYVHILRKKEIENYLLNPLAITLAINERHQERKSVELLTESDVTAILLEIADSFKNQVQSQLSANIIRKKEKLDIATMLTNFYCEFETRWKQFDYRMAMVPGKLMLSALNERLQREYKISITLVQIINHMNREDVDEELFNLFNAISSKFSS